MVLFPVAFGCSGYCCCCAASAEEEEELVAAFGLAPAPAPPAPGAGQGVALDIVPMPSATQLAQKVGERAIQTAEGIQQWSLLADEAAAAGLFDDDQCLQAAACV